MDDGHWNWQEHDWQRLDWGIEAYKWKCSKCHRRMQFWGGWYFDENEPVIDNSRINSPFDITHAIADSLGASPTNDRMRYCYMTVLEEIEDDPGV